MLVLSLPSCTNHSKQVRMVGILELNNNQTLYSYVIFVYFNAANESLTACMIVSFPILMSSISGFAHSVFDLLVRAVIIEARG